MDNDVIIYSWTQISGKTIILSDPNSVSPTFTQDSKGIHEFQLIGNDGKVSIAPDTVIITVNNKNVSEPAPKTKKSKKACIITTIINNKKSINFINSIKDQYLLQNDFSKQIVGLYYKVTTKLTTED